MTTLPTTLRFTALSLVSVFGVVHVAAQLPQLIPNVWNSTDGMVKSILAQEGKNEVHIAGSFSDWDAPVPTGAIALVDAAIGNPDLEFAQGYQPIGYGGGQGSVLSLCPDQSGGWFIGGQFTQVGSQMTSGVARLDANGTVMPWASTIPYNVTAMGVFDDILVAATDYNVFGLDRNTGFLLWSTSVNGSIHDLVIGVHDLNGLDPWFMIGGGFDVVSNSINTVACGGTAFISTLDGMPMAAGPSFYSATGGPGEVYDLELTEDFLFVGGRFERVSSVPTDDMELTYTRQNIASFGMDIIFSTPINSPSNWAPEFLPAPGGYAYVKCLDYYNGKVYVGGEFRYVNGAPRNGLACVDDSGWPTPWDPVLSNAGSGTNDARVDNILGLNSTIYVSGYFSTANSPSAYAAAFSEATAAPQIWDPGVDGYVEDMQVWNNEILLAGQFSSASRLYQPRLTALNSLTGYPSSSGFNCHLNEEPNCMARKGDTLLLGGEFTFWDGLYVPGPVKHLAAINALTGEQMQFNVEVDDIVDCMVLAGDVLYLGGRFDTINGEVRHGFAALNATNGEVLDLNPLSVGEIRALEIMGSTMYMSGSYGLAAIDLTTGQFLPWSPPPSYVTVIKQINGHLYLGGEINIDQTDRGIIEVDPISGALLSWQPVVNTGAWVKTIAGRGSNLIVGGEFTLMGGQVRNDLAMLDQATGAATSWDPQVDGSGSIESVCVANNRLYVGGYFTSISGMARNSFAMFTLPELPQIYLTARAWLQGPYVEETGLMRDDLHTSGFLPSNDPYPGLGYLHVNNSSPAVLDSSLLQVSGGNAIVDWVVMELRNATSPQQVSASVAVLLQRDGDIVMPDGSPSILLYADPGDYYLAIRHRNHLGVMTAAPLTFGSGTAFVDFTVPSTGLYGTEATAITSGSRFLWTGDVNRDGSVKYTGMLNDRDAVLQALGSSIPTNSVQGYLLSDVNLDGSVTYTGDSNDRDAIFRTIGGIISTTVRVEQLP